MKIDRMISREDFFSILQTTLNQHLNNRGLTFNISQKESKSSDFTMHIYEKLNAIITGNPSKEIKDFLKTEYDIRGSLLKKLLVKLYLCSSLNSNGILSNKIKIEVSGGNKTHFSNILIYPCNRKIRIFDFSKNEVEVIVKNSFPLNSIKNEIEFRTKHFSPNIEPLIEYGKNWYRERIIDGKPLARIKDTKKYNKFKEESLIILQSLTSGSATPTKDIEYKKTLREKAEKIIALFPSGEKDAKTIAEKAISIFDNLIVEQNEDIPLKLTHGDFHHGNIWVENKTDKIFIIDWETSDTRSEWYDIFTLYGNLRSENGVENLIRSLNGDELKLPGYKKRDFSKNEFIFVLFEEFLFRLSDIEGAPFEISIKSFKNSCNNLIEQLNKF